MLLTFQNPSVLAWLPPSTLRTISNNRPAKGNTCTQDIPISRQSINRRITVNAVKATQEDNPQTTANQEDNGHQSVTDTTANATSSTDNNTQSKDDSAPAPKTKKPDRNLYQILGASPTDSKSDLKRRYISMAKQTHPDALVGQQPQSNEDVTFTDIAEAYRILSDKKERQRYDRTLKAEALSQEIQRFANDVTETAAPRVLDLLDTVAMPFIRRTTATTLASIQEAAREFSKYDLDEVPQNSTRSATGGGPNTEGPDLGEIFQSAMKAAQKAGRIVDNIELMEKSEALENQLLAQLTQAKNVQSKLESTTAQRVRLSVHSPEVNLTPQDAWSLINYWNTTANIMNSNNDTAPTAEWKDDPGLRQKIQDLQTLEMAIEDTSTQVDSLTTSCQLSEKALQKARADKVLALQAEKRAREALVLAQRKVAESNTQVNQASKTVKVTEKALKQTNQVQERLSRRWTKQQRNVRNALQKKDKSMSKNKDNNNKNDKDKEGDEPTDDEQLQTLQKKEAELMQEYSRLEVMASSLESKANRLKEQAQKLRDGSRF